MNVTEYLERLFASGVRYEDLPALQLLFQKRIRERMRPGEWPEKLEKTIDELNGRYRNALFHLLASQTSCYRYWGQGLWTDYGREILRRAREILTHDF